MRLAVTRPVSPRISECELTFHDRAPIDYARAAAQHRGYERMLEQQGCAVIHADELPDAPDGVFVEDAAIVLDEVAVITRPGAESRRCETSTVASALKNYRPLHFIQGSGCLDGGDVLRIGRTLYVGQSGRTNGEAAAQLRALVAPFGYDVVPVPFRGCLHLKSAATYPGVLLFNPDYVQADLFGGVDALAVDPAEPDAANALLIGDTVVVSASWPLTRRRLESRGLRVFSVDAGELEKAEAGVTCCSLVFEVE